MRLDFYYFVTDIVDKLPYCFRLFFWTQLYYYNIRKYPDGYFTLNDYKEYAIKN